MSGETVRLEIDKGIARLRLDRPEAGNAINARMVADLGAALTRCEAEGATILVLEGSGDSFCAGGDFEATASGETLDPAALYDLWRRLAEGPFVSVALVRGRANAGGVGLAAACDIVLADRSASFGLSEMLFGLFPACVLPFLARRIGAPAYQRHTDERAFRQPPPEIVEGCRIERLARGRRLEIPAGAETVARSFEDHYPAELRALVVRL
ncbi:enoyl-CoA hydratase-related protein [Oceanibaculum nanhaiense]|uniref:enoyl-CoA hydratase-related protein n=1 Tax=Oceanibaculum nanhaiense TaxID=1909734 RepID=UPI00396ED669